MEGAGARKGPALGSGASCTWRSTPGPARCAPTPSPAARHDAGELEGLLARTAAPVAAVCADKAYDSFDCHEAILAKDAQPVIPPRKGAAIRPPAGRKDAPPTRGEAVARIAEIGRKAWKAETGYHRRSLAETAMYRYKTLIGPSLRSRTFDRQKTEAAVAVHCINRFTALGMPQSVRIA